MTPKILQDLHPLTIIKEVEKWPVLYSKDSKERGNKYCKAKAWRLAAKNLIEDWDNLVSREQDKKVEDLIKKWRNLRDTFRRQVETDKRVKEGLEPKKRPYMHYEHMQFLLPHVMLASEEEEEKRKWEASVRQTFNQDEQQLLQKETVSAPKAKRARDEEVDEDKLFALSIIPSLKRLSDDDKLTAKMEILKVLRDIQKRPASQDLPNASNRVYIDETATDNLKVEYIDEYSDQE